MKAVYCSFYHFARDPFAQPEDARHIFSARTYRKAILVIVRAIAEDKAFIAIEGSGGSGKTTVLNAALAALGDRVTVVRASGGEPHFALPALLERVLGKQPGSLRGGGLDEVFHTLIHSVAGSGNRVLVIDQADRLAPEILDHLLLLSTLMRSRVPLLQVVLAGPPGFWRVLR